MSLSDPNVQPLVVSLKRAAQVLDVSEDTVERLVERGDLRRVQLSARRVGITWHSLQKLIGEAE